MLEVNFNQNMVEELLLSEIQKKIEKLDAKLTFWDLDELSRQTCMSIGNIKDKFFYDARFPKYKVGGKWYFPCEECQTFLLKWIKEQPKQ